MLPRPPIIGVELDDRPRPSAVPVQQRINARQPFATQLDVNDFTGFTVPALQGRITWKPEGNPRLHVQDFSTEYHLPAAAQCKVDVVEVITFLLTATAPLGANLGVEDAY